MSKRIKIPNDAEKVGLYSALVLEGPHKGGQINVELWEGEVSRGYQSGYNRIPYRWVRVEIVLTDQRQTWSYSGRRLVKAVEQFNDLVDQVRKNGGLGDPVRIKGGVGDVNSKRSE